MLCHLVCVADLRTFGGVVLFAGSVVWFHLGSWVFECCLLLFCVVVVFSCFCVVFLFFSQLCSCAGQALFGRIKIVSVIAFFLMKNVLRHGRKKCLLVSIFNFG